MEFKWEALYEKKPLFDGVQLFLGDYCRFLSNWSSVCRFPRMTSQTNMVLRRYSSPFHWWDVKGNIKFFLLFSWWKTLNKLYSTHSVNSTLSFRALILSYRAYIRFYRVVMLSYHAWMLTCRALILSGFLFSISCFCLSVSVSCVHLSF